MTRTKKIALAIPVLALAAVAAWSASFLLQPAIVDSGGGRASASGHYEMQASIGAAVVAPATGNVGTSTSYKMDVRNMSLVTTPPAPGGGGGGGGGGGDGGCGAGVGAPAWLAAFGALTLTVRRGGRRAAPRGEPPRA